jgi:hypothetical protein
MNRVKCRQRLADALAQAIGDCEESGMYEDTVPKTGGDNDPFDAFFSHFAENMARMVVEMLLLQIRLTLSPRIVKQLIPSDFDWLRKETAKRAGALTPALMTDAFCECFVELLKTKGCKLNKKGEWQ